MTQKCPLDYHRQCGIVTERKIVQRIRERRPMGERLTDANLQEIFGATASAKKKAGPHVEDVDTNKEGVVVGIIGTLAGSPPYQIVQFDEILMGVHSSRLVGTGID